VLRKQLQTRTNDSYFILSAGRKPWSDRLREILTKTSGIRHYLPVLTVMMVAAGAGIQFFGFISDYAVNVLFYDQWDVLDPLFQGKTGLGYLFFYQHGMDRQGLGLIADSILYPLTNWNARAEAFLVGGCIFAAMLLALLLKYRLFGKISYGDVAIPLIFLTVGQYETFVGSPNVAYSGLPLLLMMLYCHALLIRQYQLRYALCLALNYLLVYSSKGVFMGIVTLLLFGLECFKRFRRGGEIPGWAPVAGLLVAGASLGSFFYRYKFETGVDCFVFPYPRLVAYPRFLALMAARFFDLAQPFRLAEVGGLLLLVCVAAIFADLGMRLIRGKALGDVQLIAGILLTFTALFAINTAVGRVCLEGDAAQATRYVTLLIPGVLGGYLYLQTIPREGVRRSLTLVFVLCLLPGCLIVDEGPGTFADGKRGWVECYLRTGEIIACERAVNYLIYPDPEQTRMREKLAYLKAHRLNLFAPQSNWTTPQ